ncbi:MAG: NAD(P)/FAD-dependent oxidoreductase [Candidatus Micrarchaeota archaeon]|nr:NAD(P)/FAD-dependent oxidoreductase [Candidatus Micrarchaeota archaeon]
MVKDVIIVGGGVAGFSTAIECSMNGLDTLLIEKNEEVGQIIKTSAVTWSDTISEFDLPNSCVKMRSNKILFNFLENYDEICVDFNREIMCTLDYQRLLQEFSKIYLKSGGELMLGTKVSRPIIRNDTVEGVVSKKDIRGKIVIDASGSDSVLCRFLGLFSPQMSYMGIGMEYELSNVETQDAMEFYVGSCVVPIGYAWFFPISDNSARLGISSIIGTPTKEYEQMIKSGYSLVLKLDQFMKNPKIYKRIKQAKIEATHAGIYPLGNPIKKAYRNGFMAVGDAAAQAGSMMGEGIRYALKFGKTAGIIASEAIQSGDISEKKLRKYGDLCNFHRKKVQKNCNLHIKTDEYWMDFMDSLRTAVKSKHEEAFLSKLREY